MSTAITAPGLFEDISESDYHNDPCPEISLSRGVALTLVTKSPLHAMLSHPRLNRGLTNGNGTSTKEMDFGSVGHKLLLGKGAEIAVGEWDEWRKNEAKQWRIDQRAAGHIPILQHVYERALGLEEAAKSEFARLGVLDDFLAGQSELVAVWTEQEESIDPTPLWFRAMFDRALITDDRAVIFDVKITDSSHPDACARQIANLGYQLQDCHYLRGLTRLKPELAGHARFIFLFIENEFPFCVTPVEISGEWKMIAEKQWARAVNLWAKCLREKNWPSYCDKVLRVEPPGWLLNAELRREFENQ